MEKEISVVKMSRQELYDQIWEISLSGVAKKYNLNYSKLISSCHSENIPFPSSAYWTRKKHGKDVSSEVVALPELPSPDHYVSLITKDAKLKQAIKAKESKPSETEREKQEKEERKKLEKEMRKQQQEIRKQQAKIDEFAEMLGFLSKDERNRVLEKALSLYVHNAGRLHPVLVEYKKSMNQYRVKLRNAMKKAYYNPRLHKPENEPMCFSELSEQGVERMIVILNSIFKAVEELGGTVESDLSVKIKKDHVRLFFAEGRDKVIHELTKHEAQELLAYEDTKKNGGWASKPIIRQYDHPFNGRLRVEIDREKYIRDNDSRKLEDRLDEILIWVFHQSEHNRIEREKREEEERLRREKEKRQEELRKLRQADIEKTIELQNKSEDYRIACEIRMFVKAMIDSGAQEATPEWVEWAKKKADWFDPIIAADDKLLGIRNHGKSKEEKALNKTHRWWG